jgi:hypothetical protein
MDRDMVNCRHYLYQRGALSRNQLDDQSPARKPFWCGHDTRQPLSGRQIVTETPSGGLELPPAAYQLLDMIEGQLRTMPTPAYALGYPLSAPIRSAGEERPAFLAISYAPEFAPVKHAILQAATQARFRCEVTGDLNTPGNIVDQVWQGIRSADVVIAEFSSLNANVMYELGLAHALGKEVIAISQQEALPFDIRSLRRITYTPTALGDLQAAVTLALKAVSARYPHEGDEPKF